MPHAPRVLAFAGSLRTGSFNKMLVRVAAEGAREAGAEVTVLDLRELSMPIYDADIETEHGIPENGKRLKSLMKENDGLLISTPEYNTSVPGGLKNAIDWASRPEEGERELACFDGKVAALMSASPGAFGGMRSLLTLRAILANIRVLVIPQQLALPRAHEAFAADGRLIDPKRAAAARAIGAELVRVTAKLAG
ncbi:MAG TPA: NAD(P)H-dependent oxidoreductase [Planctomycetota bacterium]|nr:NAD(P)H-dependent oxidoreductase [Planctomycetota bacterium]